jgi:DNA-binding LytR/AlgR family response regulator
LKITIQEDAGLAETEVVIRCAKADEEILRLVAALTNPEKKLTGTKDGRTFLLDPAEILYFESVDKKTFAYTQSDVFEIALRLYELEERLPRDFFRASKSAVANIGRIKSILPDFGGRLEVTLVNGERLVVSRQYAHDLKRKLEI